ncbi:MAG: lipoyl(octanoyl) transferase LipB [Legionellales bacterium]|nr:lipoyl(octanoyl) transferase LipB [Legionellales bacterium]
MKIHALGMQPYELVWEDMKLFTANRDAHTLDEIWLLEHFPVYTQGQAGKPEHVLKTNNIPIVQSDRGGQITYHGPGQLVAYILVDIQRRHMGVRSLVCQLEQLLIKLLHHFKIPSHTLTGAPGVYVDDQKIASIGLRVKNGRTYHGIALNVTMDLRPFSDINPCGYAKLQMTQMKAFDSQISLAEVSQQLILESLSLFSPTP